MYSKTEKTKYVINIQRTILWLLHDLFSLQWWIILIVAQ
jgi:hypothetical protein